MKITCKQCGYENEPERVYCHNCGTKLDRSVLPKEESKKETPENVRKRVRKFGTPGRFTGGMFLKLVFSAVGWGLVAACLILAIRPPRDVPAVLQDAMAEAPPIAFDMEDALSGGGRPLTFHEQEINAYLAYAVKATSEGFIKYQRTYVNIDTGKIWITTQWSLYGYPLFATAGYELSLQGDNLVARNVGGYFGRLPVHPELMQHADYPFHAFWDAMKRERRLVEQMDAIDFREDRVLLRPGAVPRS